MGKKLVTMLVSVGFFAVLITVLNLMALQAIRGKNNVLIEQFEQYEEAVENNDTAVFETAKGEVVEAIRHSNYRINGSIIFDLALVVADIIVIVLLSIVINKSIVRPAKRAKNDLDDIILGIESGQGNLTLRVFDETSDEIGQLANGVNHFIETLQNLKMSILNSTFFHVFIVLLFCTIRNLFYCIFSLLDSAIVRLPLLPASHAPLFPFLCKLFYLFLE